MKPNRCLLLIALALSAAVSGCATGNALHVPGSIARPAGEPAGRPSGRPVVAVLDFTAAAVSRELGRDFDHVRPIVWDGAPGKTMADLIADVLNEKGVAAVRVAGEAEIPAGAAARVWGRVEEFRVEAKRAGLVKVENAGHVVLTVYGSGPQGPAGWNTSVASDFWDTDIFVTPEGVRDALAGAANAAAEEAVRRLVAGGIVAPPAAGASPRREQAEEPRTGASAPPAPPSEGGAVLPSDVKEEPIPGTK